MVITDIGGISDHRDIVRGKAINPLIVKLHEWYTGKMNALGSEDPSTIYKDMIYGKTD